MIALEQACQKALEHFKEYWGEDSFIKKIQETESIWIICPKISKDIFGVMPVSINKKTGELNAYPTQFHFDEIKKAKKVKIPKAYH